METKDFIIELEKKDMKLWLNEEGGLAFKGPKNFMTDDLLNQIKERKEEIVECLKRERFIKHDEKGKYLQFPLNDMQSAYYSGMKRIYELGGTSCYTYLELEVPQIDVLKLEQAWHQVIAKHDMLRAIVSKDGMQQILEKVLLPRLDVYDEDSLEEVRSDMEKLNFDIEKGPNHILKITKMKQGYIIHFAIDMLIADFVSINIILNDLFKAYKLGFLEINPKEVNFRDIVMDRIEKKEKIKSTTKYLKGKEYWLNKIDKMPDRPLLPIIQSKDENEDASFKRYEFEIAKNIWDNIKLISGRKGLTASNAVLGAFSEIIKKWSSNEEFVLSITLMDRQDKEMNIVGDFTAVDLLTVRKQSGTFLEKIKELQKELLMDLEHLSFSGIEVLRELNRRKKSQTIFPVVYTSTIGTIDNREEYGYLYNEQIQIKHGLSRTPQVWIDCHVIDEGKCLKINWDVREHIFNEHVIRKMLSAFQTLLKEMGTSEKVWEEKNPIKCDGESINIRERKNATDKKYVPHMLYEGFLKQITERSENIAIIHDHQKYSYRDLEGYVGGIQKRLLEMGVGHGDYVAIIMPRSALQIASVLAVSLLGGIFVPLDYEQPIARQKNILRNLNPKVILLNSENKELQGDCVANTINLLQDNLEKQKIYVNSDNKVSDYAYVIYTSGTTGQPKGVVMSHKGNSILEQLREEINALNLFFPEGGTDVALSAYKDNLINEALNKVISFLVNESIQLKKKVKILEVGAGVGGTTIPVITNLVHHDITYCFTDISKFFLNNARKNFEDYDFMEYKLFDINMNFEEQGFYEDSYDLIICANVLHNSKNIPEVLGKLKHLLKSEGKLLIIEATKESYALLTSLELKGGLDQFTDDRRDNDIIFNSKHSWEEKLKVSGFNVKFILPSDEDTIAENGQRNFKAECYILKQDKFQIEMLANLDKVPAYGAVICCMFVKQTLGTGFPARCFAVCPE